MSETTEIREESSASMLTAETLQGEPDPLLGDRLPAGAGLLEAHRSHVPAVYSDAAQELSALLTSVAVFDAGSRVRLRVTGHDRVRWLNGMVTNSVKGLAQGTHNYTFVLNAQGRIQGDATIFACADHLILESDRSQAERLFAHLDHFIIMDDVELAWIEGQTTLGLAGPGAQDLLIALGLPTPEAGGFASVSGAAQLVVVGEDSAHVRRFSVWIGEAEAPGIRAQLLGAGAMPAGSVAVDALRVLEGIPLYGVDITEKTLAQETGQMRALNFNKGCYLGQEIVERVRSRANIHRAIRQFALRGERAAPGTGITADGAAIGELTSVAEVALPQLTGQVALGLVRVEALRHPLTYVGGAIEVLAESPLAKLTVAG